VRICIGERSEGELLLTGELYISGRKTCPSAKLPTTNSTWTDMGLKLCLCIEKSATDCLAVKKQGLLERMQDVTSGGGSDREIQFVIA